MRLFVKIIIMRSFSSFETKPAARTQIVHFVMSSSMRLKCLGKIEHYAGFYNRENKDPFRIQITEISDDVGNVPYKLVHQLSTENASFDCLQFENIPPDVSLLASVAYIIGARRAADGTPMDKNDIVIVAAEELEAVKYFFQNQDEHGPKLKYFDPAHHEEAAEDHDEEA